MRNMHCGYLSIRQRSPTVHSRGRAQVLDKVCEQYNEYIINTLTKRETGTPQSTLGYHAP